MEDVPSLSKNAQKRLIKQMKREETKALWRKNEKMKRKEAHKRRVKALTEQGLSPPKRFKPGDQKPSSGFVVFDLNYEGMMSQKELGSLCSQISRCYAVNRRSDKPFNLEVSNFVGETKRKMEASHKEHVNWNFGFSQEDLDNCLKDKNNVVYLSADAEEALETVDCNSTFVIGGLVDRNRFKGASLERAKQLGLKTAKLPLSDHVDLNSVSVLTGNRVLEGLHTECSSIEKMQEIRFKCH